MPFPSSFEQLRVGGRIIVPRLIERILDSKAEEMCPHAVGKVLGEEIVFGAGQPAGQFLSRRSLIAPGWVGSIEEPGNHFPFRFSEWSAGWMLD